MPIISIHALRVEGDKRRAPLRDCFNDFYPRPPGGGRHRPELAAAAVARISIHALRVEGDAYRAFRAVWYRLISIHALRVEGDSCTNTGSAKP